VPVHSDEIGPRPGREPLQRLGPVGGLLAVEAEVGGSTAATIDRLGFVVIDDQCTHR